MVGDNFKGTLSVLKSISHCTAHPQCNVSIFTWLIPKKSLWRGSSEFNIQFVPWLVVSLRMELMMPDNTSSPPKSVLSSCIYVIVVTCVGVMYLSCINQGQG